MSATDPPTNPAPLLSVKQLAAYLNFSERTIWRLYKEGELPHKRVGSSLRFDRSEIDAAISIKRQTKQQPV